VETITKVMATAVFVSVSGSTAPLIIFTSYASIAVASAFIINTLSNLGDSGDNGNGDKVGGEISFGEMIYAGAGDAIKLCYRCVKFFFL
jgi:hypothetical protein